MKVILKADVKGQGKKGDMIEVSEGYGRNFLLPRGLAELATADNINMKRQADEAAAHRAAVEKAGYGAVPRVEAAAAAGAPSSPASPSAARENAAAKEAAHVRMRLIGDLSRVPEHVRSSILGLQERTAVNTGMTMVIALSYSARWEITHTMQQLAERVQTGELKPADIDEAMISSNLATAFMPDPDLLIRTGGEVRLSNYLLWQCAYSELYFCDTFWPDFDTAAFCQALADYQNRERRFGKTSEQVTNEQA